MAAPAITPDNVDQLQHVAVSRLTLFMLGQIHELYLPIQDWLTKRVLDIGDDEDGGVREAGISGLVSAAGARLTVATRTYVNMLNNARVQGADIAFRSLAERHNLYVTSPVEQVKESFTPDAGDWRRLAEMWMRRRNGMLQVAQRRALSDELVLSQRIWRLEQDGLSHIRATLASGMANRTSATRLAQNLEQDLGAGRDMPRWAYARLQRMTPTDRMNDLSGLLKDPTQRTQGIAYNALRLARNEIQYANHAVTTDIAAHSPWVIGRWVVLSPGHPKIDICDEWAGGGPYEKDLSVLPLHPQCMCHYKERLMPPTDFARQVRGWVEGNNQFLDEYSDWLGMRALAPIPDTLELMGVMELWLNNNIDAMATTIKP
jgi:hypothetical protein